jgi:hypothetical protein
MKKLLLILVYLHSFITFAQKQNTDVQQILAILDRQTIAWNNGNLDTFMEGYLHSDSLIFVGKNGVKYGYSTTLTNYKRNYPDKATMGNLKFDILKVNKLTKNHYFVIGHWHLERKEKGDLDGHYSLIFQKIKNVWVIISDHSS